MARSLVTVPEVTRLPAAGRALHQRLMEAAAAGDGLGAIASIAGDWIGAPVAIVVPRIENSSEVPVELREYVDARVAGDDTVDPPYATVGEQLIELGRDRVGLVIALESGHEPDVLDELLYYVSAAAMMAVAIEDTRDAVEEGFRGSFFDELLSDAPVEPAVLIRRAGNLGCDLSRGAVALCVDAQTERPRHIAATIESRYPGAIAQLVGDRIHALLPAAGGDDAPEATARAARDLVEGLRGQGAAAASSFYSDPAEFRQAVQEAELVLEVVSRGESELPRQVGRGTYRLLFRVLASHPEEVRAFYDDTVAALVRYDSQYSTDLVGTLDAYLRSDCNMNSTAAVIFAHRHTVAYRLDRVRELTGLDPFASEDRERLGLGLKAYRIIQPALHR